MTLNEFCELNPQLIRPPLLKCELIKKAEAIDLEKLNSIIKSNCFLMSRRWLPWILENYENIIAGCYFDFGRYNSSVHTANERIYTDEELDRLIVNIDDIDF